LAKARADTKLNWWQRAGWQMAEEEEEVPATRRAATQEEFQADMERAKAQLAAQFVKPPEHFVARISDLESQLREAQQNIEDLKAEIASANERAEAAMRKSE